MSDNDKLSRIEDLVLQMAQQSIALGQRLDIQNAAMAQQSIAQAQRLDIQGQRLDAQGQRIDETNRRIDEKLDMFVRFMGEARSEMREQQAQLHRWFEEINAKLDSLPDDIRGKIVGFARAEE